MQLLSFTSQNGQVSASHSQQSQPSQSSQRIQNHIQSSNPRKIDLRPLRDKNYQSLISQEIYDFLVTNRYEIEMKQPLTPRTLRQPTQKDFVLIFQFLYGRLDPNYRFARSMETEVFAVLRSLGYPYLESINRLSISAVGGQNWPSFLGMLYWLVKVNLLLANFNPDLIIAPDDVFDRLFIKYIIKSYRAFIDQNEDYQVFYEEMKRGFDAANEEVHEKITDAEGASAQLKRQYADVYSKFEHIEEAEAKSRALENDLRQFSEYMAKMKERQAQWGLILEQMRKEIANAEEMLLELGAEKSACESAIIKMGHTIADIDKRTSERERLAKSIDSAANKIVDVRDYILRKKTELRLSLESLASFVNQYTHLTLLVAHDKSEFEAHINPALMESELPNFEPEQVLNRSLKDEKSRLFLLRGELALEALAANEEIVRVAEQIDQHSEKIFEEQEELETIEAELAKIKAAQEEIYEVMVGEGASYSAQIEKLDRELQGMQINVNKGILEAETRLKNLEIAYQEWKFHIKEQREALHDTAQRLIDFIISFKLNVQENIEDLHELSIREVQAEEGAT